MSVQLCQTSYNRNNVLTIQQQQQNVIVMIAPKVMSAAYLQMMLLPLEMQLSSASTSIT